uniref:Peptidase S9 prolyl oligopeptidase catalytic domain-containing protein n=1 Tax=Plectus sambesii TaxID=2011161 RepID=A0A914USQ1_9BILA
MIWRVALCACFIHLLAPLAAVEAPDGSPIEQEVEPVDASTTAKPAETPLIPRAVLFDNPDRADVSLSADGKTVGYLAPYNDVLNIWVIPIDELLKNLSTARPVTFLKGRGVMAFVWTYMPGMVIFGQDHDGDENMRLWKLDINKKELKPEVLADKPGVFASLIRPFDRKHPELIKLALNERDKRFHDHYIVNLVTGKSEIYFNNTVGFKGLVYDNGGRLRLGYREDLSGGNEYMRANWSGDGRQILSWETYRNVSFEDKGITQVAGFSKDNSEIYWYDAEGRDFGVLLVHPFDNPANKTILYTPKKSEIASAFFHPFDYTLLSVTENYERHERYVINETIRADIELLRTLEDTDIFGISYADLDFDKWFVTFYFDNLPATMYYYDRKTKRADYLFSSKDVLLDMVLSRMHPVEVKTRDNLTMLCYISLPVESDPKGTGRPFGPLPMVLSVHGGPSSRDYWGFSPDVQHFTNRGYAVLQCNFRGSSGFGRAFLNAGNGEWAGKMHDDLIDASNWAIQQKIALPDKIAIEGGSYGGYAALVGLTFTPDFFACGIDVVGPSNLVTLVETIPSYWAPAYNSFVRKIGGDPRTKAGREFLISRSPLTFANRIKKPLLIAQGANDPRVKRNESDQIVRALKKNDIPVTYLVYPDEGHGFRRPENQMSYHALAERFLSNCLGGRFEPTTNETKASSVEVIEVGGLTKDDNDVLILT